MKKIWIFTLLPLVAMTIASTASAEFYRFKDKHGNIIYTDDLSKVPESQRSQATMYEESSTRPATPDAAAAPEKEVDDIEALKKEGQRLLDIKETLDKEYNELASENSKLKAEQEQAVTPDQIKAVNKKVVSFNTRFQAYQEKSAVYEADVKAYNERLKAAESQQPPGTPEQQ